MNTSTLCGEMLRVRIGFRRIPTVYRRADVVIGPYNGMVVNGAINWNLI